MDETIYSRFQDLPISFEYIYMQIIAMEEDDFSIKHLDELDMLANILDQTLESTLIIAILYHCQDKRISMDLHRFNNLLNGFIISKAHVCEIVSHLIKFNILEYQPSNPDFICILNPIYFKAVKENNLGKLTTMIKK